MASIMFFAPTPEIAEVAKSLTAIKGLDIPVEVASRQQAVELVQASPGVEVVIARSGTANQLKKATEKVVVELPVSIIDILGPISNLATSGATKIGVVLRSGGAEQDICFKDVTIFIRTFKTDDELLRQVEELARSGVDAIVAQNKGREAAKRCGLPSELIDSGQDSIAQAIDEAVKISKAQELVRLRENERSQQLNRYVTEMYTALERAITAAEQLSASSEELAATSQEAAHIAKTAGVEVNQTSEILEIIRRVSQQTNLLGINAAIEAVRAGENGRGFAVVANEVRKLADESTQSAANIKGMLSKFREAVEQVLKNVEQSNDITQEQALAMQEIARTLEGLRTIGQKIMNMADNKA
ncbi:MAG TPA: PrpR N-terminal domain-containing protein [Selenomonadales bacterium]|nr:PrpR N-terminal domain-containing protein [Selenomonadales bacterium]